MVEGLEEVPVVNGRVVDEDASMPHVPDEVVEAVKEKVLADPQKENLALYQQAQDWGWHMAVRDNVDDVPHVLDKVYTLPGSFLSFSQVNLFMTCAEKYRRVYVEKEPRRSNSNMVQGQIVHRTIELLNLEKLKKKRIHKDMAKDIAKSLLDEATEGGKVDEWSEKVPDVETMEKASLGLVEVYERDRLPHTRPKALEIRLIDMLNGRVPFQGYIDMVEYGRMDDEGDEEDVTWDPASPILFKATDCVIDLKTVGKTYPSGKVDNSLQLSLYAASTGAAEVGFDLLVQGKRNTFTPQRSFRTPSDVQHAKDVVEDVARSISAGLFPRTDPESWACSPKWCQFYGECRERRLIKQVHITEGLDEE